MLASLKKIFNPEPMKQEAHLAYDALTAQARVSWFYEDGGVPDTIDGRFDMIVLHVFLLAHRLKAEGGEQAQEFSRLVMETFFSDMDRNLREMGVTDTGTGKRIKQMAQAFNGRMQAYEENLEDVQKLRQSLHRNLYRESETVTPAQLGQMAEYVQKNAAHLQTQPLSDIVSGKIAFTR